MKTKKFNYNPLNAVGILTVAVEGTRYVPAGGEKVEYVADESAEVDSKNLDENHKKTFGVDHMRDENINAEGNDLGKSLSAAIVGLHSDLSDPTNVSLLTRLANYDKEAINQLKNEASVISKYKKSSEFADYGSKAKKEGQELAKEEAKKLEDVPSGDPKETKVLTDEKATSQVDVGKAEEETKKSKAETKKATASASPVKKTK